ncbi:MAG: hypothetical protein JSV66_05740 [Trueperaceae bacterium]|nr:MAG: hypothetical protein JSV66_05740 [Trueperaceae bacterium]
MTTNPRRFLFPMWEGGGTLPPMLGVARQLLGRGHQVQVIADPTVEDDAKAAGCSFTSWRRAPHRTSLDPQDDLMRDWEVNNPLAMLKRARDQFIAGPARDYAADTFEAIEAFQADVVVPDVHLFGAIIAAQAAKLPVVPLVPNIWMLPTPGSPPVGPGFGPANHALARGRNALMRSIVNRLFDAALPTLNGVRSHYGLEPLGSFYDQALSAEKILVLSSPTFDFASSTVPSNVTYVGPVLDDPSWAEPWTPPWSTPNGQPLVLVGFSSTFQDQGPLLRRVVAALSELPVRAVVTLGQMLAPNEVAATENVSVIGSAPHGPILEQAQLAVTHCGHGTTLKALSAGVPLVCIPMGRDQNDTAARVVHQGAGVRLSTTATVNQIRTAVERVLKEPCYADNANRLAADIARERSSSDLVGLLEAVAPSKPERVAVRA